MNSDETVRTITKANKQLRKIAPQDYPVLIQNLLLFAGKDFGALVLEGIVHHFSVLDVKMRKEKQDGDQDRPAISLYGHSFSEETLRRVEGDALWKINFTIKQNKQLASQYLKAIKIKSPKISSFFVSTLLAMTSETQSGMLEYLKSEVNNAYCDLASQKQSEWMAELLRGGNPIRQAGRLNDAFLESIENGSGWDFVIPVLVQLAFLLIDSSPATAVMDKRASFDKELRKCHPATVGTRILRKCFFSCSGVQKRIVDEIFDRILTFTTSFSSSGPSHFLRLLQKLIISSPHEIADKYAATIREIVDYLPKLSPSVALQLIEALHPLYNYHTNLRDNIILVLRKAMFSVDLDARRISVRGFLSLLEWLAGREENPSLQEELLNSLRRCLGQQLEIKEELYQGLQRLFEKSEALRPSIARVLSYHVTKFLHLESSTPIHVALCFKRGTAEINEPICHLFATIMRAAVVDQTTQRAPILAEQLNKISEACQQLDLEEYELVGSATADVTTPQGEKLFHSAGLLYGLIQVSSTRLLASLRSATHSCFPFRLDSRGIPLGHRGRWCCSIETSGRIDQEESRNCGRAS